MTSSSVLRNFTSIALTACCAIGIASAGAQTYSVTDLGILPDQTNGVSTPAAISGQAGSDQVQVSGTSGVTAFRYTMGKKVPMEDVGKNPDGFSRGFGLNASGQVVGDSTFGKNVASRAALFSNGSAINLGNMKGGGAFSRANSINASGKVVGFFSDTLDGTQARAFIIDTSNRLNRMTDLGTLGGLYAQAMGINDSGFVTGNSQTADKAGSNHAFIWQAKTGMLDLGTLGGDYSYGTFISSNNHVVGYSLVNNSDSRIHAFLHNGKEMVDLGSLSGASPDRDFSFALGINAKDQVVGYSYLPSDEKSNGINTPLGPWPVAFVYSQGLMVNLNDHIGDAVKDYRLDSATAINDNGQIVAVAFSFAADAFHAVLLTPIAEAAPALAITSATYAPKQGVLAVQATCTGGSATPPTLNVYVSSTGELIGALDNKVSGQYSGSFVLPSNPEKIMVKSSNGLQADAAVEEIPAAGSFKGSDRARTTRAGLVAR